VAANGAEPDYFTALTIEYQRGCKGNYRYQSGKNSAAYTDFNYVLDRRTFISGGPINNGGNV